MSRMSELGYPERPGFKKHGPSEQAAKAMEGTAAGLRARALAEFAKHPVAGATADEVAKALGLSILSIRPRVSELHRSGEIVETEVRRKNESGLSATVWRIAAPLPAIVRVIDGGGQ